MVSHATCTEQQPSIPLRPAIRSKLHDVHSHCLSNIMLLFSVAFFFKGRVLSCVTPACEAHNIRHCIIKLSSVFPDANNNNKGKVRQPVTVTLYVTALGELTSPFCRRALADCHLVRSPWGLLLMNQRKWELHILKRVNVSNQGTGRMLEDSSSPPLLF